MADIKSDIDHIDGAYESAVKNLFGKLLEEFWRVQSQPDKEAKENEAVGKFRDGLTVVRSARDRAKAAVK